jgi:hypothetical protein
MVAEALTDLAHGDIADACGILTEFIHKVQAQSSKSIPTGLAAQLIAEATRNQALLAC